MLSSWREKMFHAWRGAATYYPEHEEENASEKDGASPIFWNSNVFYYVNYVLHRKKQC
jgi:hypothetical protein